MPYRVTTRVKPHPAELNWLVCQEIRSLIADSRTAHREFAARLWWDPQALSRRMTGKVAWTLSELSCVAEALDTTALQLISRAERKRRDILQRKESQ